MISSEAKVDREQEHDHTEPETQGPFKHPRDSPQPRCVAMSACNSHACHIANSESDSNNQPYQFQPGTPFEPFEMGIMFGIDEVQADVADCPQKIEHNEDTHKGQVNGVILGVLETRNEKDGKRG
ncbi:hypothetical protein KL936_000407 [Ogataea polymorpha]|nr:hypothetical protein KL936_000407 [Ogataea polymorpha]